MRPDKERQRAKKVPVTEPTAFLRR
jgi:hypothetical protein